MKLHHGLNHVFFFVIKKKWDPLKKIQNQCILWNNENKSFLNVFKFLEVSRNPKPSKCWKFVLFISIGTQKSAKMPQTRGKVIWSGPFDDYLPWFPAQNDICLNILSYVLWTSNWLKDLFMIFHLNCVINL